MSDTPINYPDRQLPEGDEVFLDHVAWMSPDMDRASAAFERLGFVLTPYSVHGNRDPESGEMNVQGSANRLAMLHRGYIEILTAVEGVETPVAANIRQSLDRYEGLHLVAFTVSDADADYARLEAEGVPLQPLVHLRREIEAADGSDAEVAFSVIRPDFGTFPEGRMQVLSHHTPDHMWQERYIARENCLDAFTQVVICVEDPDASAARLAGLTRTPVRTNGGGEAGVTLDFARGRVTYVKPSNLGDLVPGAKAPTLPFMAAIGFRSRDLAATKKYLTAQGVSHRSVDDRGLVVDAADALGCSLLIE